MKKAFLLAILISSVFYTRAQRFFYIERGNMAERSLQEDLLKASQFVTRTALESDYTIKTEIGKEGRYKTILKIIVEDSASFIPIYQANEKYVFGKMRINEQVMINMALRTLIEKNINQIIYCSKNDHQNALRRAVETSRE
jgi:hypothetical protein